MGTPIEGGPWHDEPGSWSTLFLAERAWPGFATVHVDRANKWDKKKAKGVHKSDREFSGADDADVKITIRITTTTEYNLLKELLPLIEPDKGKKKADAYKIEHPAAQLRKVSYVTIDKISGPKAQGRDIYTVDIDATECSPPEKRNATGRATGSSNPNVRRGDCDEEARNLQRLRDQWAKEAQLHQRIDQEIRGVKSANGSPLTIKELEANRDKQGQKVNAAREEVASQIRKIDGMKCTKGMTPANQMLLQTTTPDQWAP